MDYQITEIYETIQGEGIYQGTPSILIRLKGCNLSCVWCDSKSDYKICERVNLQKLKEQLVEYSSKCIVLTGGEPMSANGIEELCGFLKEAGYHITIETNGTIYKSLKCDLLSVSPKLLNSNPYHKEDPEYDQYEKKRLNIPVLNRLLEDYKCQLKFVISEEKDLSEVIHILGKAKKISPSEVFLMANAKNYEELKKKQLEIVKMCLACGFRYANRLQLQLWDEDEKEQNCVKEWGRYNGSV